MEFNSKIEEAVFQILSDYGPLTGQELSDKLHSDVESIMLWKVCYQSNLLRIANFSRYYLRYDVTRANQLRLSPSILRDFLTYSLIYRRSQQTQAVEKSAMLTNKHRAISNRKIGYARKAILSLDDEIRETLNQSACFFVSGDLAYALGHDVPRVHGELETIVHGSDIDIIIVYNNEVPETVVKAAEEQMLRYKYKALKSPEIGEELDFIFKPISKLIIQLQYRNIHEMIASKILYESFFIYGNLGVYDHLIAQLKVLGTQQKLERDFHTALIERKQTIGRILDLETLSLFSEDKETQSLFYFSQEKLEFQ